MAIPLVAMIGLLAYVTSTQVDNAINLDRAPDLINATSLPATKFGNFLETERTAAVVYLSKPSTANLQAYQAAIAVTDRDEPAFKAAMTSPATVSSETPDEAKAISAIMASLSNLTALRNGVQARAVSALDAMNLYSQGIAAQPRLFLLMTNSEAGTSQQGQAIALITIVQAREELSQEQALLAGVLAGQRMTGQDRIAFTNVAATRQADLQYAQFELSPANLAIYNARLSGSAPLQQQLGTIEQAVEGGTSVSQLPITLDQWQSLTGTLLQDQFNGGVAISQAILAADHQTTHAAWVRVAVTGGIALLGLIITVLLTSLLGRSIIRRLRGLETSALTLAQDQLPDVIGRLRHGEDVDVAIEAPPLRADSGPGGASSASKDEIGRVSQAFDLVRQTALRAAVDEARLRQGLNDVFRSLARRSQSLLHRQLTLLDQMERRATDPEALDDLFRLDHLTTRMRRHAEGLVILAGAPPSRGWSSPIRMVDVMRGAIAEVEDYARVSVAIRSQAALAGSAVADVIHLLAELIENATTLSPPYTSVRVSGDTVANGFAIEVEDRGLGMNARRLAELNDRLANPPEFNPSDSEQLGLFVVGQLAKRHGIRVTLKASPYGGTSAVVLIPQHLIVTEDAFRAGLPGEPASITTAGVTAANGHRGPAADAGPGLPRPGNALGLSGAPGLNGVPELNGAPERNGAPEIRISGPLRGSQGIVPEKTGTGSYAPAPVPPAAAVGPGAVYGADPDDLPRRHPDQPVANGTGRESGGANLAAEPGGPAAFDAFLPRHHRDPRSPAPAGTGAGANPPASAPVTGLNTPTDSTA
ncbi:MAG: nitrate- and nitrite sensing domain-containing protein, partial [Streptosporangiaceae bacterium]